MPDIDLNPTSRRGNGAPTPPPPPPRGRPIEDPHQPPRDAHGSTAVDPEPAGGDGGVLGLSLTGILGGALAAVSAAALGARLGVAGTLAGAAIGSVFSAVTAAAYTHSLRHTRTLLRKTTRAGARSQHPADERAGTAAPPEAGRAGRRRPGATRVAALALTLFAAAAVIVTGIELGIGRSLDGSGATTVGEVVKGTGAGTRMPSSSPTDPTPASTSSSSTSEPTSSSTTPASPTTSAPSGSGTSAPTSDPATSPATGPTATAPTTPGPATTEPTPTEPTTPQPTGGATEPSPSTSAS